MSSRAERRRRTQATTRAAAAPSPAPLLSRANVATAIALGLLALVVGMRFEWLRRQITWYLAVDQFGYFTFARDILAGRLFHAWPPGDALARVLPPRTDVLVQSYIWDNGHIYSRYAPGFPLVLAAWIALVGENRIHTLNPILFCTAIVLVAVFVRRLTRSWWRGLAAAALIPLCPTQIHWWGLTLTRDVATHVIAFTGLLLLLPSGTHVLGGRRTTVGALVLGFTAAMRPDAVMYLIPAGLLVLWRWRRERAAVSFGRVLSVSAAAYAVGIVPLLVYSLATTGSPLPAQSIELNNILGRLGDLLVPQAYAVGWKGGIYEQVQGGGLKLANLARVLPLQLAQIRDGYGIVLSGAALWGVVVAFLVRRPLFLLAVPYTLLVIVFFSGWTRPDPRYLIGAHLWIPMLAVEGLVGTLDLARATHRLGRTPLAQALAAALAIALVAAAIATNRLPASPPPTPRLLALQQTTWVAAFITAAGAVAAAFWPRRRITAIVAPALGIGLAALAAWTDWSTLGRNASFQRPQMERARATLQQAVEANGVIITAEDIGRPMENIEVYGGRRAIYLTDFERWRMAPEGAAAGLIASGMRPYVLLPPTAAKTRAILEALAKAGYTAELVVDIPAPQAMDFFVAAPFHRGIPLGLWRIRHDKLEATLADLRAKSSGDRTR